MKQIIWLVQRDLVSQQYQDDLNDVDILKRLNLEVVEFDLIPFENKIVGLEYLNVSDDLHYIVRAGTNAIRVFLETGNGLTQNVWHKIKGDLYYSIKNFDQKNYLSIPDLPCINKDSELLDLSVNTDLYASFSSDKFIKPTCDLKAFDAGILEAGQVVKHFIENGFHHKDYQKNNVIISSLKNIIEEYRFFICKNEVVGSSRYFVNGRLNISTYVPELLTMAAKRYIDTYSPSKLFVLDLGLLDNEKIEIVEYNCFSASGTYAIDRADMFNRINKFLNS